MKQKVLINHGLQCLLFALLMLTPLGSWAEDYPITVAGVQVTSENANDIKGDGISRGKVTFTPANDDTPATLTLANDVWIECDGNAIETSIPQLRVLFSGDNGITSPEGKAAFKRTNTDAKISVIFEAVSQTATLAIYNREDYLFDGVDVEYANVSIKDYGDNFSIDSSCELKVGDIDVTFFNKDNIFGDGTASFTPADNSTSPATAAVLTLNGADIEGGVSTSLRDLTVELIGSNKLTQDNNAVFNSVSYVPVEIRLQSTSETKGSLTMKTKAGNFVGEDVTLNISQPLYVMSGSLTDNSNEENTVVIGMLDCEFHKGWTTYYNADIDINNLPAGVGAFVVTGLSENAAVVTQINNIPNGVPVLLNNETQTTTTNVFDTDVKNNMLKHAVDAINDVSTLNGTVFGLYNGSFMRVTGSISAGKNYLYIPNATAPNGAPQLTIVFENDDNMTGISDAKCGNDNGQNDEWYTLNGQKLMQKPAVKGLYFKNGKKVVVNNK